MLFYIYDHLFHPEKCQVIHICTNKRFRRHQTYKLHGHSLESVYGAKYLSVKISVKRHKQPRSSQKKGSQICLQQLLGSNLWLCDIDDPGPWVAIFTGEKRRPQTDTPVQTTEQPP